MFPYSRSRVRKSGIEGNNERYSICVAILLSWFQGSFRIFFLEKMYLFTSL